MEENENIHLLEHSKSNNPLNHQTSIIKINSSFFFNLS